MDSRSNSPHARVQIWGKGFRVTNDSEEFQRYVPLTWSGQSQLENTISLTPWGQILEQLYNFSDNELGTQFGLLFNDTEFLIFVFAHTTDRHKRPSLLLVGVSVYCNLRDPHLASLLGRSQSLAFRVARSYADTFAGNPESVQKQLKNNTFLQSRNFDLSNENYEKPPFWTSLVDSMNKWEGITGIATPRIIPCGANVMIGTKHEAERARRMYSVDGYFDSRDFEIRALSNALTLKKDLVVSQADTQLVNEPDLSQKVSRSLEILHSVDERLKNIEISFQHLIHLLSAKESKRRK